MTLNGKNILLQFMEQHADAKSQVESWIAEVEESQWGSPHDLKNRYPSASIIGNQNVVFNICGNRYRLWVIVAYKVGVVLVKNIGTHQEYDKWKIG